MAWAARRSSPITWHGCRQPRQVIGKRRVPAAGLAEPVPGARVDLPVDRLVRREGKDTWRITGASTVIAAHVANN